MSCVYNSILFQWSFLLLDQESFIGLPGADVQGLTSLPGADVQGLTSLPGADVVRGAGLML